MISGKSDNKKKIKLQNIQKKETKIKVRYARVLKSGPVSQYNQSL